MRGARPSRVGREFRLSAAVREWGGSRAPLPGAWLDAWAAEVPRGRMISPPVSAKLGA